MPSVTRARSRPRPRPPPSPSPSPRELAADPIEPSSPSQSPSDADGAAAGLCMPQSQVQGIDDAPTLDADLRRRSRIFPLDEDGDEILDQHASLVAPARPPVARACGVVDALLAKRTERLRVERERGRIPNRPATRAGRRRGRQDRDLLQRLIKRCRDEVEEIEIRKTWNTPAGKRKIRAMGEDEDEDEDDDDEDDEDDDDVDANMEVEEDEEEDRPVKRRRRTRASAAGRRRTSARRLVIDDDDDDADDQDDDNDSHHNSNSSSDAEQVAPRLRGKRSSVQTTASTSKHKRLRKERTKSVPLPKKNGSLLERLQSRGSVPDPNANNTRLTRAAAAKMKKTQTIQKSAKKRKKRSKRRKAEELSHSDVEADCEAIHAMLSDSSADADDDVEGMEAQLLADDDDDADNSDHFEISDDESEPSPRRKKNTKKKKKKSNRRKRTQPKNRFESSASELSAREQRERLDFLVKQSADIAHDLHKAMADAVNERTNPTSKSPVRNGETPQNTVANGDDGVLVQESSQSAVPVEEEKFAPPNAEGKALQPHQTDGVKWLLALDSQGLNAILADEMGLGKTIQTLAFLASLVISGKRGPHLVIAPKNVCEHWAAEVKAWYPGQINVVTYLGHAESRLENMKEILEEDNFDILVTSFELALRDLFTPRRAEGVFSSYGKVLRAFRKVEFEYLVVDEAHRLKNDKSRLNIGIRNYQYAQRRLLLTGTPLSNNLKELWCLMNILNPKIFSSKATFEMWFSAPFEAGRGSRKGVMTHAEQSVIVDRLHTIIRPFFRRRVRADVCPSFTSADEILIRCPMSRLQKAIMLHFRRRADDRDASKNNILMAMRGVSSHPYISSRALYDTEQCQANTQLVATCGKFAFLHYSLPRLLAGGHRVLIFSQFRRALDFLEDLMDLLSIKYGRLDGMTTSEDRMDGLERFNAHGSDLQVFLLSTRAGGVGINLQTADTVILFDSDWNPSADLQAVSRIQRIGQTKTVHIMRLMTEKSVDSIILETSKRKLRTQRVAVGAGKFNTSSGAALDQKLRQKDLEELIQELDIQAFLPIEADDEPASEVPSQSSPESVSPNRIQRCARDKYYKEWSQQLLRTGETELPEVSQTPIWLDSVDKDGRAYEIPVWLGQDANLASAGKALECMSKAIAIQTYENSKQSIAQVGAFHKKDRARRARRKVSVDLDFDLGTDDDGSEEEGDGSEDPTISVEQCSDVSDDEDFVVADKDFATAVSGILGCATAPLPLKPSSTGTATAVNGHTIPAVFQTNKPDSTIVNAKEKSFPVEGIHPNGEGPVTMTIHRTTQTQSIGAKGPQKMIFPPKGSSVADPQRPGVSVQGLSTGHGPKNLAMSQFMNKIDHQNSRATHPSSTHQQVVGATSVTFKTAFQPASWKQGFSQKSKDNTTTQPNPPQALTNGTAKPTGIAPSATPMAAHLPFIHAAGITTDGRQFAGNSISTSRLAAHSAALRAMNPNPPPSLLQGLSHLQQSRTIRSALPSPASVDQRNGLIAKATAILPKAEYMPEHMRHPMALSGTVSAAPVAVEQSQKRKPRRPRAESGAPQAISMANAPTFVQGQNYALGQGSVGKVAHIAPKPVSQYGGSLSAVSVYPNSAINGPLTPGMPRRFARPTTGKMSRNRAPRVKPAMAGMGLSRDRMDALGGMDGMDADHSNHVASIPGQSETFAVASAAARGSDGAMQRHSNMRTGTGTMKSGFARSRRQEEGQQGGIPGVGVGSGGTAGRAGQAWRVSGGGSIGVDSQGKAGTVGRECGVMARPRSEKQRRSFGGRGVGIGGSGGRVQGERSDQGSPLYSRNPRTIRKGCSSARRVLSFGKAEEAGKVYSLGDLQSYVGSLGENARAHVARKESFETLVRQLQDATKVNDIDFLTDALLACRCDIGDAADYIYERIS